MIGTKRKSLQKVSIIIEYMYRKKLDKTKPYCSLLNKLPAHYLDTCHSKTCYLPTTYIPATHSPSISMHMPLTLSVDLLPPPRSSIFINNNVVDLSFFTRFFKVYSAGLVDRLYYSFMDIFYLRISLQSLSTKTWLVCRFFSVFRGVVSWYIWFIILFFYG